MFAEKIKVASGLLDSNPAFVGGTDIEWSGYFAFFFLFPIHLDSLEGTKT